jgi:hypothetical protein
MILFHFWAYVTDRYRFWYKVTNRYLNVPCRYPPLPTVTDRYRPLPTVTDKIDRLFISPDSN